MDDDVERYVYLLYALYPCVGWDDDHGATIDCECEEYLEGCFSMPQKAKDYAFNEESWRRTEDLDWQASRLNPDNELASTGHVSDKGSVLWYFIERHLLD